MDTLRSSARFKRRNEKQPSRLISSVHETPVAFGVSAGVIILGFAVGTALCKSLGGGALAASLFLDIKIDVWAGFITSALYNLSLAAAVLLLRVSTAFAPLSFIALSIKSTALGFAFDAARASPGGLAMSIFAVLMPSLPAFTALSLLLAGGMARREGSKERLLRDLALFFLGILSEGLLSQAVALFIDAAA